jgi:hypothetical protein
MNECLCDVFVHPAVIQNSPGRATLAYRVGDYASFRRALLLGQPGERELLNWRPSAHGDLALQMVEWWAYLADILTFYNERSAHQSYLRTADLPESVVRLIYLLGYRPRPGIGAQGVLAALASGRAPFTLPAGFKIQSKPGPGKQPQIFELDHSVTLAPPDTVAAEVPANPSLLTGTSVLLKGTVTTLKAGDELLLLQKGWQPSSTPAGYARVVVVQQIQPEKAPGGKTNTRVVLSLSENTLPADARSANFRLVKSAQSAHLYPFPAATVIGNSELHLDTIYRDLQAGEPIVLKQKELRWLAGVTEYKETIYYANTPTFNTPTAPPTTQNVAGVAIPHSQLRFESLLSDKDQSTLDQNRSSVSVHFGWQEVGELIGTPRAALDASATTLAAAPGASFPVGAKQPVLLEGAAGAGVQATATVTATGATMQLTFAAGQPIAITPPLNALFHLLPVSRGQTVPAEILGSGDATKADQEFVLKQSPLTYLPGADPASSASYRSTLRVWVDGVEWKEAPGFFEQPASARIFVTREDEEHKTHVLFGDGVNGARLPSGVNNVIARYRYGSGADAPGAGQLTVIVTPQPGLKAIRNPVAVGGGDDPDPPEKIRHYAPQSVLTFGRAVSADDYTTIAAQANGVARARSYWSWDAAEQRTLVTVYVGDNASAVASARSALALAADPNRPLRVELAAPVPLRLSLSLVLYPDYMPAQVEAQARSSLLNAEAGLVGVNALPLGNPIYQSEIYAACLVVPGVLAVHKLQVFIADSAGSFALQSGFRYDPGEGKFFQLAPADLILSTEAASYAG